MFLIQNIIMVFFALKICEAVFVDVEADSCLIIINHMQVDELHQWVLIFYYVESQIQKQRPQPQLPTLIYHANGHNVATGPFIIV